DRALGRAMRLQAQYATVDTWLQEHGMLSGVDRAGNIHANRKDFRALIRSETRKRAPAMPERQRGPKTGILQRVMDAMENALAEGQITRERLAAMPDKELEDT